MRRTSESLKINSYLIKCCPIHLRHSQRQNSWTKLDKSPKSCPPCYSQSPLLMDLTPPPSPRAKVIWNWFVNIVNENLQSENSQDYAQSVQYVHEFGFSTFESVMLRRRRLNFFCESRNGYFQNFSPFVTFIKARNDLSDFKVKW
jgi:hypothetical protein